MVADLRTRVQFPPPPPYVNQYIHTEKHCITRKNGYLLEHGLQTGISNVPIKVLRVRNNSDKEVEFCSAILPPYLNRTQSFDKLIPVKWVDYPLSALLDHDYKGLSAKNITYLTAIWQSAIA